MTRYVALLRGINVGGITIKMADLKDVFTRLGYGDVRTVLASGNVVFGSEKTDPASLKAEIEATLGARFGYEAFVFVLEQARFAGLADACPFEENRDGWHTYVVFVADPVVREELLGIAVDPQIEQVAPGEGVVYWHVVKGSTLSSAFGKVAGRARYKSVTTTRNMRTIRKLQG
ncbi:DUF1697 domain-containing protein [Rhodococcus sp. NPDC003382]|uniref:DUF1697 domain-containing protein n=1 Tax=unclassified Rhodococcus (in: high G+C Gram-positive bacteria) TaxID=192944 RepID=UPI0018CCC91D|nr:MULTISPECIES: DUF1697 domain-containing protein [unclassified Rhodococcus (in: high G+C Gram-positive bacteria)]MBH0119014.1 DUF1697 domain-containing protein [Rhodococcus sp. CX]MCK8673394.1 DUF1697 domain-containing protein [Rhodococcus sp. HM1]